MLVYTGIGSRNITEDEVYKATIFAGYMMRIGMILYTGDATGGDDSFLLGAGGSSVIWTPYNRKTRFHGKHIIAGDTDIGRRWVKEVHPNPSAVLGRPKVEPYLVRDAHQVIGMPPEYPQTMFVVYIATCIGGTSIVQGGSGQAVRIATKLGIPTFNLRDRSVSEVLHDVKDLLGRAA